ncbi:hypothetical protein ACTFAO_07440 [Sphingobacterium spiritivorum]|uniref:hypothetical protein n=1 Tax=Sphingobacterium spiritivorum TaxID=258 RepID=UPI003F7700E8
MAEKKNTNQTATPGEGVEKNLQKQNAEQASIIADLKQKNAELEALQEGHLLEIKQKRESISNLDKVISEYHSDLQKKDEMINTLNAELANLSTELSTVQKSAEQGYQVVKVGDKSYRVHGKKFNFDGQDHSTEELQKNSKLLKKLIEVKAGFLQEIKEEKEG